MEQRSRRECGPFTGNDRRQILRLRVFNGAHDDAAEPSRPLRSSHQTSLHRFPLPQIELWSPAPFSPSLSLAELAPLSYRFLNHRGKSETFPLGELVEPSSLAERSETSRRVRELRLRVRSLHPIRYPPRLADSQCLIVHTSQTRYSARKLAWYNSLRLSVPVSFTVGSLKPFKGFSLRRNSKFFVP